MIFDKNRYRIAELTRRNPDKYADRIRKLISKGPEWWIKYRDAVGRRHEQKCPPEFQGVTGAQKYYNRIVAKIEEGIITPSIGFKTDLKTMVEFYLIPKRRKAQIAGKSGGLPASETYARHIVDMIGKLTLARCIRQPNVLQNHIDDLARIRPHWASKTKWNYCKILHAVFQLWIKKNLLNIPNPMDGVDIPDPDVRIMEYVPTQADYNAIIMTSYTEGCCQSLINLIGAARYSGLRINEILAWQVSDIVLFPQDGGLPYFWVDVSKQKRKTRVAVPMVSQLRDILINQIGDRNAGYVWPWKNPPYKLFQVGNKQLYELAGVQVPRPFHDFRKTFKMELKRQGLSKDVTKSIMGHATDAMDDWYTHFGRSDLESAVKHTYGRQAVAKNNNGESDF